MLQSETIVLYNFCNRYIDGIFTEWANWWIGKNMDCPGSRADSIASVFIIMKITYRRYWDGSWQDPPGGGGGRRTKIFRTLYIRIPFFRSLLGAREIILYSTRTCPIVCTPLCKKKFRWYHHDKASPETW